MFRRIACLGMIALIFCIFTIELPAQESQERAGKSQVPGHSEKKSSEKYFFNPEQQSVIFFDVSNEEEAVKGKNVRIQKTPSGNEQSTTRGGSSGGGGPVLKKSQD